MTSLAVVSIVCITTLWITRWPGFRVATLVTFILCGYGGVYFYFRIIDRLFPDHPGEPVAGSTLLWLWGSVPFVVAVSGWLGAAVARLAMRYIEGGQES